MALAIGPDVEELQDPKKFARGMQLLQLNEEIKTAKKVSDLSRIAFPWPARTAACLSSS